MRGIDILSILGPDNKISEHTFKFWKELPSGCLIWCCAAVAVEQYLKRQEAI